MENQMAKHRCENKMENEMESKMAKYRSEKK